MALKIRLARAGTKKRPFYHMAKDAENRVVLNNERAQHWLSHGAQPTDRVLRFLDAAGLVKREARNNPNKGVPGEKAKERAEEKAAKAAAAAAPAEEAASAE